jgi:DNA-binding transcriptional ArsR family regulator
MLPDAEAIAEQVFVALADPSRRAILAALASGGPATATDLAGRLPITRQAIAKHLALLQVAQQFLAALARDWDGPLEALQEHLSR